jgi:RNA-directed DNA polymerase
LGNLSTPKSVQKLQTALHAKAKAEAGYRFYALYDKISREDILAHAYAQCRSNKGAPGVDGQDFVDVDAYGVQRWLGELALALRQETYRPDPIRRVFIPKANGKLRPLGISTLRDRVCMTAAMLVLEPIFEADLPQSSTPTVPGETPNRRWSRWKSWCSEAIRKSLTPTSRTTSGAFRTPNFSSRLRAELLIGACCI